VGNKANLFTRYWRMLCRPSTAAMGLIGGLFFAAGIVFWGGFNWGMEMTNTEQFCIGCHSMKENTVYPDYTQSIHYSNRSGVRATCSDCHVPHEWTDKIVRKIIASAEVWGEIIGSIDTPEKFDAHRLTMAQREWKRFKDSDSLACRNCHDESYMNFDKQGSPGAYMHSTYLLTAKATCIDCHRGIAHRLPEIVGLEQISPDLLEPLYRPPYDHAKTTLE
jgi:cytochrome c-type protein NapC